MEGVNFPFFGVAFSIEKVLYNYESKDEDLLDFSKNSILHAQYVGNFIVDEARLSANEYNDGKEETEDLIFNYDAQILKRRSGSLDFSYLF